MLDAGVPLKRSVAGVAMGLLLPYEMKKGASEKVRAPIDVDNHSVLGACSTEVRSLCLSNACLSTWECE